MQPAAARALLGLPSDHTREEIADAFRAKVRACHPDSGGTGGDMAALVAAKDLLLANSVVETPCKTCQGRGYIGRGFGLKCSRCGGTGNV